MSKSIFQSYLLYFRYRCWIILEALMQDILNALHLVEIGTFEVNPVSEFEITCHLAVIHVPVIIRIDIICHLNMSSLSAELGFDTFRIL